MLLRMVYSMQRLGESLPVASFFMRLLNVFDVCWSLTPWIQKENPQSIQHSLLRALSIADKEQLDAQRVIGMFAYEHWGVHRHRLLRFACAIDVHKDWLRALENTPGLVSQHVVEALRVGRKENAMDAAWRELLTAERPIESSAVRLTRDRWAYWPFLAVLFILVGFLITPQNRHMVQDFGSELSGNLGAFRALVVVLDWISGNFGILLLVLLLVCVLGFSSSVRRSTIATLAVLHPRRRLRESAQLLHHLSVLQSNNKSLEQSLYTIHESYVDQRSKHRLAGLFDDATIELNKWTCLEKPGFITADEANAIESATNPSVRSWVLRHLSAQRRETYHFRNLTGGMLTQPVLTIVFGCLVLWVALAMTSVLNELVYSLAKAAS